MRYEALFGPNTKQFWLYDDEHNTFIDPPIDVLEEVNEICWGGDEDDYDAAQARLEEIAAMEPDWLHDGNEYDADELDP